MKVIFRWTIDRSISCGVLIGPAHEGGKMELVTYENEDLLEYLLNKLEDGDTEVTRYLRLWGINLPEIKTNNRNGISTMLQVTVTKRVTITHEEIQPNLFTVHFHPKGVEVKHQFQTELYMP